MERRRQGVEKAGSPSIDGGAHLHAAVEQIPALTFTESYCEPGVYTYISPQVTTIFGYTPEDVTSQPDFVVSHIHPEDLPLFKDANDRSDRTGEPFRLEFRFRARDGRWVWVRSEAVLVRDEHGEPLHWQGVLFDVTDRKRAEEELRASDALCRTVLESAPVGIVVQDASGAIVLANEAAQVVLGRSPAQLIGKTSFDPEWDAISEDGSPFPGEAHPATVSLRTGKPCDSVVMGVLRADGGRVWFSVNSRPLLRPGEAAPYAVVVTFVDLTQRFALESALRQSEERFRLLVQDGYDIITIVGQNGRRRYVSPSITRALGFAASELEDGNPLDLIHPDDVPRYTAALAELRAGLRRTAMLDLRFRHRDGGWRDFESIASNLLDEPAIAGVVFNSRDVTERKAAVAALRESEARFRAMFEGAAIATVLVDTTGRFVVANAAFGALFGYDPAELVGMTPQMITHPDDNDPRNYERQRVWAGEAESRQLEKRYLHRDGRVIWGLLSTVAIRDASGHVVGALGQVQDITARKAIEAALRESEERLQSVVSQVPVALYRQEQNGSGTTSYVSPQWAALLGLSEGDVPIGLPALIERMHPADRVVAIRAAEVAERTGSPFDVEYRLRHADGHWIWIRDHSHVERDEHGRALAWTGVLVDVTEHKRLTASLRESQQRFRRAFEDAPIGMSIGSRDGICIDANAAYCRILGRTRDEIIGRPFAEFTHPDDIEDYERFHRRLMEDAAPAFHYEKRYLRPDCSVVYGLLTASVVRDERGEVLYDIGQLEDITERKRLESAARESEERFRVAFNRTPIGLALVRPDGTLQQVNQALCDLLGYTEQELLERGFLDITHPDDRDDDQELANRLWAGEIDTYQLEKRFLHKDGRALWCELTASVGRNAAGERYGIGQVQDITSRRHLDLERAIMLASEREYARQLRELSEMRTNLTAMVAHELGAPISALRVMTAMLETGELPAETEAQTFAAIQDQITQLDRLVADVAAAATAERDDFPVQFLPVSLTLLLGGAATIAQTTLVDHPFTALPAPDVRVWCDPERIHQVLRNLLDNAARHTPPGTPVTLRSTLDGDRVCIEVVDGGSGIPEDDRERIFEKFGRGREAADQDRPGVGLGLYLSRRIVEEHGGELTVESVPGRGATFRFYLKVAP